MAFSHSQQLTWVNVSKGKFNVPNTDGFDEYTGVIESIGIHEDTYEGRDTTKLHILMSDPYQPEDGRIVIVSTLYNPDGSVCVFPRMIIQRLAYEENNLTTTDRLRIVTRAAGAEGRTTTAFIYNSSGTLLEYADVDKDNPTRCRQIIDSMLQYLIGFYGEFIVKSRQQPTAPIAKDNDLPF